MKKEKRYSAVYSKLKDFEDYILSLNINVDPNKICLIGISL